MKKLFYVIPMMLIVALSACTKEETISDEDTEFDLKANKMVQTSALFESIARQPEMAATLTKSFELIYASYTELLPISGKAIVQRGKARGQAFAMLFVSVAYQPEAYELLDAAAAKFLGAYNAEYINDELAEITKTYAYAGLAEALARQPEASEQLNALCKKYLNYEFIAAK